MSKIFAFDVDGTLLNAEHKLDQWTIDALRKAKEAGHTLILCSGRGYVHMTEIAKQVGAFDFMVCNNGTYFVDLRGERKHYYQDFLDLNEVKALFEEGKVVPTFAVVHTKTKGTLRSSYFSNEDLKEKAGLDVNLFPELGMDSIEEFEGAIQENEVLQATLRTTKELVLEIQSRLKDKINVGSLHIANDIYLDLNPKGVDKWTGLMKVANEFGLDKEKFITFGDSGNDIHMLEGANLSFAMGNGNEHAKKAAKEVIGPNNEPSLANKLLELI